MTTKYFYFSFALIGLWLGAIVAANLTTTHFAAQGHPEVSVYTAFGLIAFDLVARDVLHDWYRGRTRWLLMAGLVLAGSALSIICNPDAETIAKASTLAFAAAFTVDTVVYQAASWVLPWFERSNLVAPTGRMEEVFNAGRRDCTKLLRGMGRVADYPFYSVDSSNVGQNHGRDGGAAAKAIRLDAVQSPTRWVPRLQTRLEVARDS